jgi:Cellulose binding domain
LTATAAVCSPVAAGVRPIVVSQCVDQGAASCGGDGTCDGAGACRLYLNGTVCVAGLCASGATRTPPRLCNGAGTCLATANVVCPGGFLCDPGAGACKTACTVATSAADCLAPNVCTGNICGTLELQYQAGGVTTATTVSPHPQFLIVNLGAAPVPLSDLTIRYWYTADGAQAQAATVDYAANSNNVAIQANVTSLFAPITRTGADTFLQLGFAAAAGTLAANGGTTIVQSRFNSLNPAFGVTYVQTGDYSFDAIKTSFADWTHVTLYQRGTLVWGIEPP